MTTPSETERSVKPISELVGHPDFPQNTIGETVDINGYVGVVIDVVKNSIKVRPAEGQTMSYNFNALKRLHGPKPAVEEITPLVAEVSEPAKPAAPKRDFIQNPDFNTPLIPIEQIVHDSDFPAKAFGLNIDLHGYSGVVVELVNRSLKVRSPEGSTRSYNADGLRKIYKDSLPDASQSAN